jgi:ribulose-5-phosphate 4-epimerase/fuculose-1-phosphate aldolase
VIHAHTLAGMAVSAMKCGLLPIAQISMRWTRGVSYHDYESIALNLEERERLVKDLGENDAMILRNHGLLTCGASIAECFNSMYWLKRACDLQVMMMSCNTEMVTPPDEVIEQTWRSYQPGVRRRFGLLEWPALLRELDRIDPSYRD